MITNQKALETAVLAGKILLENGAEISRVHGTITFFLEGLGIRDHQVYVVSNGIFATVGESGENPCNAVRYVDLGSTHLRRIIAVNELSRQVARTGIDTDLDAVMVQLEACQNIPRFPIWVMHLAFAAGAGGFCYVLGGGLIDAVAAFVCGFLLQSFLLLCGKVKLNRFINNILGAAWVTLWGAILFTLGLGQSIDSIIAGSIMPLVPGVTLTTAIREFFTADYTSGTIHLIDALIIATCIAIGVGGMLSLWTMVMGGSL